MNGAPSPSRGGLGWDGGHQRRNCFHSPVFQPHPPPALPLEGGGTLLLGVHAIALLPPLQGEGWGGDGVEKQDDWSTFSADVPHPHSNPSNRKPRWRDLSLREAHPKGCENHLSLAQLAKLGITPETLPAMLTYPSGAWVLKRAEKSPLF